MVLPMVETINTVGHPSGPEYQLVVGEGGAPMTSKTESASDRGQQGHTRCETTYILQGPLRTLQMPLPTIQTL